MEKFRPLHLTFPTTSLQIALTHWPRTQYGGHTSYQVFLSQLCFWGLRKLLLGDSQTQETNSCLDLCQSPCFTWTPPVSVLTEGPQNYSTSRGINGNSNTVSNSPWNVWGFLFPGPCINCCTPLWGRAEEILTGYLAMALHSLISEALFPLQSMSLGSKNQLRLRKWQRTMAFYWGDCPEPLEDPVLVSSDGTSSITSLLDAHLFRPYGRHSL